MDDLAKIYNQISSEFSATRFFNWPEVNVVIPQIRDGSKILDLGCGNGRLLGALRQSGKKFDYLGVDFSEDLIKEAKNKYSDYKFEVADINKLEFSENSFNLIFLIASFHHLVTREERSNLLKNIYSWLKPGGYLFMTNWNLWQKKYIKYVFKNIFKKKSWNDFYIPYTLSDKSQKYWRYYHGFTMGELKKLLKKAYFKIGPKDVCQSKYNIVAFVKK